MTLEEVVKKGLDKDIVFIHNLSRVDLFNRTFKSLLFSEDKRFTLRTRQRMYNSGHIVIENDCGDDEAKVTRMINKYRELRG